MLFERLNGELSTMKACRILLVCIVPFFMCGAVFGQLFEVKSPNGKVRLTVSFDKETGTLAYDVKSDETVIFKNSPLGITTNKADFTSGLQFIEAKDTRIDETYTLPQGKVTRYHNKANEIRVLLAKDNEKVEVVFRVYDDGIAFRYVIPGSGNIEISKEASGFNVAGEPDYWGQPYPNQYGYENDLRKMDKDNAMSLAVLCELKESKHWVLLAQAATYGTYCLPHLTRNTDLPNLLRFTFPHAQTEPIHTTLPFESPWRVAVISSNDLSTIVEQTLFENLNPSTEPELQKADWIKPGRSSWDWFAGDKENWKGWIDFVDEMDWEYHLIDDGWERYVKDPTTLRDYAESKGRAAMAWQHTATMGTREDAEKVLKKYADMGFKGVKVDYFNFLPRGEDSQMGIQTRDDISQLAAKYKLQIVFHGCAIPTGERRRWPHLLSTEAVKGQESNPSAEHDNCIAYVRNPLGPVDYSPVWFGQGNKTDAYQLATSVIFESGFLIFADLHKDYLRHPSKEFLKQVPVAWDETKFIDGYPRSHTVIARRKGKKWFVGGLASKRKMTSLSFDFLEKGVTYTATCFKDREVGLESTIEKIELKKGDLMQVTMADRGGFVMLLEPVGKHREQQMQTLVRIPDSVTAVLEDGQYDLVKQNSGKWTYADLSVDTVVNGNRLEVRLSAPKSAVKRLHFQWDVSFDPSAKVMCDAWERGYGGLEWKSLDSDRIMPWYFLYHNKQRTDCYGVMTGPGAMCSWKASNKSIDLWADVRSGGVGVMLGEKILDVCNVVCRQGKANESAFKAAQSFCRQMCPKPRIPSYPVYGFNNWYYTGHNITAERFIEDAKFISRISPDKKNRPYAVVDDGWQGGLGIWIQPNRHKFPSMKTLADEIRGAGARPGLWTRMLQAPGHAPKEWRLQRDGNILDPTVAGVRKHVADQVKCIRQWGYELIKDDFSTVEIFGRWGREMGDQITNDGWSLADRSMTTAVAIREHYQSIREAAGDEVVIIGCNTIGHLAAGIYEISRIGDDTSAYSWERTRKMGINALAFRAPQHGTFFVADADCVCEAGDSNQPWEKNRQWLDLVARSGTALFISVRRESINSEQEKEFSVALAAAAKPQEVGEPLDWMETRLPIQWRLQGQETTFEW